MSHTAYPVLSDITAIAVGMNVSLGTAMSTAVQQNILDSVISNFERSTRRTFLLTDATRYYNGSDTGEIIIDEYRTISTVEIVGYLGGSISLASPIEFEQNGYPKTRLQIARGSAIGVYPLLLDRFPAGRSNIKVVARWGYADTIPDDIWWGIAYQAAGVIINARKFDTDGYLIKWQEADVTQVRNYQDPFKYYNSGTTYKSLIQLYKKPTSSRIIKQRRQLV
jgi:hypothetical protein